MRKSALLWVAALFVLVLAGCAPSGNKKAELWVFAGAASKPPLEEIAARFEAERGVKVNLAFGGSGTVLSQMQAAKKGDVYLPGSPDFMERAKKEGLVDPQTERILAWLVPAINVPQGNPRGITSLADLARPGVRVGLARPETVCVGLYAAEILERQGLAEQVKKNIVTYAESCEKLAALVALKQVDAVLGWEVFASWEPHRIETIYLAPDKVPRLAYIPVAVSSFSTRKELAREFLDYLVSEAGKQVFQKWGYLTTEAEARRLAPRAAVGGEYSLKTAW